jgi:ABC-2 type transport system ATP-binding protein
VTASSTYASTAPVSRSGPLLIAHDLRKSYGQRLALRGLSFSLKAGRILGFLGPNGAGKTTAIRILTTSMPPSGGSYIIDGTPSDRPQEIRRKIGVLPENLGFPKHMTGLEYLTFFGRLYGQSTEEAKARAYDLAASVGLQNRAGSRIGGYSHGMRQRIGIARALVNDPVVLFLDEPTLGLDPRGQQELLALVKEIARERSAGIVLCSHMLTEVEGICDDVVILNLGQVVASGPVAEVLGAADQRMISIRVAPKSLAKARKALAAVPGVSRVTLTDDLNGQLAVELASPEATGRRTKPGTRNAMLEALVTAGVPVMSFGASTNRLQDLFLQVTDEAIS